MEKYKNSLALEAIKDNDFYNKQLVEIILKGINLQNDLFKNFNMNLLYKTKEEIEKLFDLKKFFLDFDYNLINFKLENLDLINTKESEVIRLKTNNILRGGLVSGMVKTQNRDFIHIEESNKSFFSLKTRIIINKDLNDEEKLDFRYYLLNLILETNKIEFCNDNKELIEKELLLINKRSEKIKDIYNRLNRNKNLILNTINEIIDLKLTEEEVMSCLI